jgi:hypothetical protein
MYLGATGERFKESVGINLVQKIHKCFIEINDSNVDVE